MKGPPFHSLWRPHVDGGGGYRHPVNRRINNYVFIVLWFQKKHKHDKAVTVASLQKLKITNRRRAFLLSVHFGRSLLINERLSQKNLASYTLLYKEQHILTVLNHIDLSGTPCILYVFFIRSSKSSKCFT